MGSGIVSRLRRSIRTVTNETYGQPGAGSWDAGMVWSGGGGNVPVTIGSAQRVSAVWACQRILSEAIATLPLDTFIRSEGVRREYPKPAYLAFDAPGQLTKTEYLSMVMLSLLTDGNAYVAVIRGRLGSPVSLVPLDPGKVTVESARGQVSYVVDGQRFSGQSVMHIKGMTMPGRLTGMSPIAYAREVIDLARQGQTFGLEYFRNAAVPPAVIEMPHNSTGPDQGDADSTRARRIAETWHQTHGGTSNAGKVGVLIGGAKLSTVSTSPDDSQWLESRQFGVQEVARIYGVPPHLIADSSNSTSWGSGLAEQNLAFGQFSLRPWIERIEEPHNRLLHADGLSDVVMKLNLDALLRASLSDRYESYERGISTGFLTVDEARSLEDLPPMPRPPEGGQP